MRLRDADALDLPRLKEAVAAHAASAVGADACRNLEFRTSPEAVCAELARVEEMLAATVDERLPLGAFVDIRTALHHARTAGAVLSIDVLAEIRDTLLSVHAVRVFLLPRSAPESALEALCATLPRGRELADSLAAALDEDGGLRDDASPRLRSLRQGLRQMRTRLQQRLERMVRDGAAHVFADRFVTQRNGRFVVPVRSGSAADVGGIVQDRSSSGETFFVEPLAAVEANNGITLAQREEAEEETRILAALTALVGADAELLLKALESLIDLDTLGARAAFARRHHAICPAIGGDEIHLPKARHVLLELTGRKAVPIEIELGAAKRLLVLSGPNAGGKSVALKTLGLAVLAAQSGIPVAAGEGARLPFFDAVFADIGDPQNVTGDLSTFSGHVRNLAEILDTATPQSLVLLDEPGTGTAPEDGAALAASLLLRLADAGIRTLASTHFQSVKLLALQHPAARIAAVDFDPESYAPRYRLLYGSVGPSLGLDVARRFGLPEDLVQLAEESRGVASDLNDAIARLETERRAHETAREALEEERLGQESARRDFERLAAELDQRRRKHWSEELAGARRFAEELRREGKRLIDEAKQAPQQGHALVEEARRQSRTISERLQRVTALPRVQPTGPPPAIGDLVKAEDSGVRGSLLAVEGDRAWVLQGSMRFAVPTGALRRLGSAKSTAKIRDRTIPGTPAESPASLLPEREIVLVGERVPAALARLESFLDAVLVEGLSRVRIVHGHGTGVLRKAIREYLATSPHIAEFGDEAGERPSSGATIARLR